MDNNQKVNENTELKALAAKVKEMRDAQKMYFKWRQASALSASKKLEHEVDVMCGNILSNQGKLF